MIKSPMLVSSLASHKMIDLSFNDNHSLALSANHQAYSWGFSMDGALGYKCEKETQNTPHLI